MGSSTLIVSKTAANHSDGGEATAEISRGQRPRWRPTQGIRPGRDDGKAPQSQAVVSCVLSGRPISSDAATRHGVPG